mgnify:CR=1 FL=1
MFVEEYDESEHSKECYAHFGLAVYYSQVLEHQLVNMLVLLKRTQGLLPTEDDFDTLYERKFSNTLGQLINEIKQVFELTDEELQEMKSILKTRNFIVHDFFKEKITLTFTRTGRNEIIEELRSFVNRVKIMDARLVELSSELLEKMGITQQMLDDEARMAKEEEINKEYEGNFGKA